jgi:hypothetical protein
MQHVHFSDDDDADDNNNPVCVFLKSAKCMNRGQISKDCQNEWKSVYGKNHIKGSL